MRAVFEGDVSGSTTQRAGFHAQVIACSKLLGPQRGLVKLSTCMWDSGGPDWFRTLLKKFTARTTSFSTLMESLFLCDNQGGPALSLLLSVPRRTHGKGLAEAVTPLFKSLRLHHVLSQASRGRPCLPVPPITPFSPCAPAVRAACTIPLNLCICFSFYQGIISDLSNPHNLASSARTQLISAKFLFTLFIQSIMVYLLKTYDLSDTVISAGDKMLSKAKHGACPHGT